MDSQSQRKINRRNRQRGSKFEKTAADILGLDVVPYSGSNARFGYGDIRDSKWLGECKNITPVDGRCKILTKWINDNHRKADLYGLLPFLTWMPAGKVDKYVILECEVFDTMGLHDWKTIVDIEIPRVSVTAVNMYIDIADKRLRDVKSCKTIARLIFGCDIYYMMDIKTFKEAMEITGMKGELQKY